MKRLARFLIGAFIAGSIARTASAQTPASPTAPLPTAYVTATETLFADGMSDPRGGRYRAIKVRVGNVWNGGGDIITTHGWVLPSSGKAGAKRAVAWNGLAYDIIGEPEPASLPADIDRLVPSDGASTKPQEGVNRASHYLSDNSEAYSLDDELLRPLKACLLLRVGETALAERVYAACLGGKSSVRLSTEDRTDPFERLAGDWAWSAFDRAVCAHMRGDDRLALRDAELLTMAGPKLEAQAAARGIPPNEDSNRKTRPYFDFLTQVPQLLADSRQRIAAPEAPLSAEQIKQVRATHKDIAERIAFLIRHLDDVAARQSGQPGGVGLDADPICEAIIREGDAAVDTLLDTMDKDTRLTRSVSFGRDFFRQRNLLTVRSAADSCVVRILHTGAFGANSGGSVAAIRAYWNANRGIPLAERWYRTLADDAASPGQWLEAAGNIVQPTDVEVRGMWVNVPNRTPGSPPPLRGESLRVGHEPTVSALLARRVVQTAGADRIPDSPNVGSRNYSTTPYDTTGIALGLKLAEWEPKVSRPTLKLLMDRLRRVHPGREARNDFDTIGSLAAALTIARVEAGDPDTATDYEAFLREYPPSTYSFSVVSALTAFYALPNEPTLARVADSMFNGPDSSWNPIISPTKPKASSPLEQEGIIGSSLLLVPAFRRQVLRELDDTRPAETATLDKSRNEVLIKRENGGESGYGINPDAPDETASVPDKQPFTVRVCDLYAFEVARIPPDYGEQLGIPRFELYWTQIEHDKAIPALKAYLTRFGERLTRKGYTAPLQVSDFPRSFVLRFPTLNHAATDDDVRAGRAIFSLANPQARPASLSRPLPIRALRLMSTDARQIEQAHLLLEHKIKWEPGKPLPWTEGAIYQAEEVQESGKWHRYYGFIGPHTMERVSAEEVILIGYDYKPLPPL